MDEVLKAKRLTEQILARAAAIKDHMQDVNHRLDNIRELEEGSRRSKPLVIELQSGTDLLHLSDDIIRAITWSIADCQSLCSLATVCKRLYSLVMEDTKGWETRCRLKWGVATSDPNSVPRLDKCLLQATIRADASASAIQYLNQYEAQTLEGNTWRLVYRDHAQGWRLVEHVFKWLDTHGFPSSVSGSMHRMQLQLALRYMDLFTSSLQRLQLSRTFVSWDGLQGLISLLGNEAGIIQELSLTVLANMLVGQPDVTARVQVGSRMGKLICDLLDISKSPGVLKQATRALVNLWASGTAPQVEALASDSAALHSGNWRLVELGVRGESLRTLLVSICCEDASGHLTGHGHDIVGDNAEEFVLTGKYDADAGTWSLQRKFVELNHAVLYMGHGDRHGLYGAYWTEASANSFGLTSSSGRAAVRIFRMYLEGQSATAVTPYHTHQLPWQQREREDQSSAVANTLSGLQLSDL